jgi:methylmalonyl-CoA epimerase
LQVKKISHVAIASSDPQAAQTLYEEILGLTHIGSEEVRSEGVNTHFYQVGESNVEILEPLSTDSPVGKFLDRKGPGIHHIALEVEDLDGYVIKLKQAGIQLLSDAPKLGAHDMRIIFIHPKSTGGVLIELSEKNSG